MISSKVEGVDAMAAFFRRKIRAVRKAQAAGIRETANEFADAIKAAAPKDEHNLESTVHVVERAETEVYVAAGGSRTTRPVKEGRSSSYDYARGQEFGTSDDPGHPFFFPTIRTRKRKARARLNKRVRDAMENG